MRNCAAKCTPFTILETAILLICIASIFMSVSILSRLPFGYRQRTAPGQPYVETQDAAVAGKITSIATDDSYLYCCWGKRHIVKVYDFDGRHVSTIAISDAHNKGGTLMFGKDGRMVVLFSDAHRYDFQNGNLISFDAQGNKSGQLRETRTAADPAGNTYFIQDGCVILETPDGAQSLFAASPAFLRLMTADTLRIVDSLLLISLLIVNLGKEKLTGRNQI